ncbi:CLUMA_CG005666, isoform A [Clunio marinus]|uniref:CLUMA_CG005666, isoform A n=1 Tax=Clunio marinus TaxID=568069 RepID=A0A1J1HVJ3_9DIPT|nr:CLUMA_CG005666, isoform A [Clunio marinus]
MKKLSFGIFIFLLATTAKLTAAIDSVDPNEFCLFQIGFFAHPNPTLCYVYFNCFWVFGTLTECPPDSIFVSGQPIGSQCQPGNWITCELDPPTVPTTVPTTAPPPTIPPTLPPTVPPTIPPTLSPTVPPTLPPTVPPTTVPPTIPEGICDGIIFGSIPDPTSCTRFIFCILGSGEILNCPVTEPVFDPSVSGCVAGNPDTCEIFTPGEPTVPTPPTPGPTTTTAPPTTIPPPTIPPPTLPPPTIPPPTLPPPTVPPPTAPPPTVTPPTTPPGGILPPFDICIGNNFRFVADPSACYRYFFCSFGIPLPGECDIDRIFEERLRGCVLGNRETCERDRSNINIEVITRPPTINFDENS